MERDYGKEIDELRGQIEEIKQLLSAKQPQQKVKSLKDFQPMKNMHPDKRLSDMMEELITKADQNNNTGAITYLGVFASGGNQSNWINQTNTDKLLDLIESNIAAKVLACIGNNDRLNMLLAILRTPRTAAQLVEQCGYNTTGQVYHHLKPLLAADLVKEVEHQRGSYTIQPHRVQGLIMLLAGISDMINTEFTQGNWDE